MPHDRTDARHDVERLDISTLSDTQRDMLWMRLRGDKVAWVFDGQSVTVSAAHSALLADAVSWVEREVWSPPRGYYPPVHPFQRTLGSGVVVAARWRRIAAAYIDRILVGMLAVVAVRWRMNTWLVLMVSALGTIVMTRRWGRTAGKFLLDIRVVDASGRASLTWGQCLVRWATVGWIGVAAGWPGGNARVFLLTELLIYVPALFDSRGRGLHDRLAGTAVITTI